MKILALEFSSPRRSVAVLADREVLASTADESGPSFRAFELIAQTLSDAKIHRDAIERLAIGLGPGSHMGIRIALAIAQGWQLARNIPVVGVNSSDAVAAAAQAQGLRGIATVVLDAQRQEFYLTTYDLSDTGVTTTLALRLALRADLESRRSLGDQLLSPLTLSALPAKNYFPDARSVGQLACGMTTTGLANTLEPINLRAVEFVKAPPPRIIPDHDHHTSHP